MAADTAQTLFNKYIANYEGKLDSQETRESRYGALNLHLNDTKMVDSGMGVVGQDQRVNIEKGGYNTNGVAIPVQDDKPYTISTSDITTCTASSDPNDTALVDVQYSTISFDLLMELDQYNYNYVSFEAALNRALKQRLISVKDELEGLSILNLQTSRNQVQSPTLGYFTDSTFDSFTYTDASKAEFYNYARALYQALDTTVDQYRVLGTVGHWPAVVNPTFAQGTGNAVNTQYQFTGGPAVRNIDEFGFPMGADFDFYNSNKLTTDTNVVGALDTTIFSPIGTVGLFSSVDEYYVNQARGEALGDGAEVFVTSLPGLDPSLQFGVTVKRVCIDGRYVISWQFEGRFATLAKYNSDPAAKAGLINRFERIQ